MDSSVSYDMELEGSKPFMQADMNTYAMVIRMVDGSLENMAALEDMRQTL